MIEFIWIVGFIILVVLGNKLYKKRLEHMTPKNTSTPPTSIGGGGEVLGSSSNRHTDGSVTPPMEGENMK